MNLGTTATAALTALLKKGQKLITQAVIASVASSSYKKIGGLSVYFPQHDLDPSYHALYWTEKNPIMVQFLQKYITV